MIGETKYILLLLTALALAVGCGNTITVPAAHEITYGTVTDVAGNTYKTVTVGTQTWMAANLRTPKYTDGTAIPTVTGTTEWANLTTAAQCTYNNTSDIDTIQTYGRLYNWYAVDTASNGGRHICPAGWHVASDADWTTFEKYLIANGYNYDGSTSGNAIAKALANTSGWKSSTETGAVGNDQSTNNGSGFAAFPGGCRGNSGKFYSIGNNSYWWSSSEYNTANADSRYLYYYYSSLLTNSNNKEDGFSVRCVKDN